MDIGLIITIAAIVGLVIMLLIIPIWALLTWDWPDGEHSTWKFSDPEPLGKDFRMNPDGTNPNVWMEYGKRELQIELFVPKSLAFGRRPLAHKIAKAYLASVVAYHQQIITSMDPKRRVAVSIHKDLGTRPTGDKDVMHIRALYTTINKKLPWFSKPIPHIQVEESVVGEIIERGEPVIHEMMHSLLSQDGQGLDHSHRDKSIWSVHSKGNEPRHIPERSGSAVANSSSVQSTARKIYKNIGGYQFEKSEVV